MRILAGLLALAIVIASGLVYGKWTGRWSDSPALAATVARLPLVPRTLGDWEGQDITLDPRTMEQAGVVGYVARRYVNRQSGGAVTVLLLCGRPGPISVHRPEICYGGVGYEVVGDRTLLPVGEGAAPGGDAVWAINLEKTGAVIPDRLRILYAWSADGTWKASDRPRMDFAGMPVLFKLYVVRAAGDENSAPVPAADSGLRFLRQFLPALRHSLFVQKGRSL